MAVTGHSKPLTDGETRRGGGGRSGPPRKRRLDAGTVQRTWENVEWGWARVPHGCGTARILPSLALVPRESHIVIADSDEWTRYPQEGWIHIRVLFHYQNNILYALHKHIQGYAVHKLNCLTRDILWTVWLTDKDASGNPWDRNEVLMAKFIRAAQAAKKDVTTQAKANDPVMFKGRPALQEYMTLLCPEKGVFRELSPLMVAVDDSSFRVGLKSSDDEGWCWRTGSTFSEALDAIEAALIGTEHPFKVAGGKRPKKGK